MGTKLTAKLEMLILWLFADLWERAESQRHVATFKRPKQRVQGVGRSEDRQLENLETRIRT